MTGRLDPAPRAVLVADAVLGRDVAPGGATIPRTNPGPRRHHRGGAGQELRADQVLGREPEHPLDGRAHVADHAGGVEDGDDVGGVLHQRAEALLAGAQRRLGRLPIGDVVAEPEEARLPLQVDPLQREQDVPELAGLGAERAVVVPHQLPATCIGSSSGDHDQRPTSDGVRPTTSSRVYPVISRKLSLTSRKRPSTRDRIMIATGLARKIAAKRSWLRRSSSSDCSTDLRLATRSSITTSSDTRRLGSSCPAAVAGRGRSSRAGHEARTRPHGSLPL